MKRSKWIKGTAVTVALTMVVPSFAKSSLVSQGGTVRSQVLLEAASFQKWSTFLISGNTNGSKIDVSNLAPLYDLVPTVNSSGQLLAGTSRTLGAIQLAEAQDYLNLASYLLKFRQIIRQSTHLNLSEKRKSLFLLQMMAEETLYVGSRKFSEFPSEISLGGNARQTLPQAAIKEFSVQTGDVLLSKSSGSGSSSLIALSMDEPHIFSHSTPAYVDQNGQTLSPEAFIEDGVKLRNLQDDYASDKKTRLYIYRLRSAAEAHLAVQETMSSFVEQMQIRTGNSADTKAAYSYDFTMTPGNIETRGLFCSSVAYEVYENAGISHNQNPYPQSLWSSISGNRSNLLQILGVRNQAVPAPGDLEVNTHYELVGTRVNIKKLPQERIELAMFDILIDEVLSEKAGLAALAAKLNSINEKPLQKEKLLELIDKGLIPSSMRPQTKILDQIPNDIKLSQLVLFGFLNEVLTPKVRDLMLSEVQRAESSGHIVSALELRQLLRQQAGDLRAGLRELILKLNTIEGEI